MESCLCHFDQFQAVIFWTYFFLIHFDSRDLSSFLRELQKVYSPDCSKKLNTNTYGIINQNNSFHSLELKESKVWKMMTGLKSSHGRYS